MKGISKLVYKMVLLKIKNKNLRTANEILNKYYKTKKTRLRTEELLNIFEANVLRSQKNIVRTGENNMCEKDDRIKGDELYVQCCSNCKQPGHNTRTCQTDSLVSKD